MSYGYFTVRLAKAIFGKTSENHIIAGSVKNEITGSASYFLCFPHKEIYSDFFPLFSSEK